MPRPREVVGTDRESAQRGSVRCDRARRVPEVEVCSADHAGGRTPEKHRLQSVRPDQGLAAQGLSADRGRHRRAEPQSGQLFRRDRAGGVPPVEHRSRASASARTRCCRRASSLTPMRTVTGSARTTKRCRSTRPNARCTTTTRTAPMRFFATTPGTRRLLRAELVQRPGQGQERYASRRCASPAMPTATIIATATTTSRSPGRLFRLFDSGAEAAALLELCRSHAGSA